MCAGVEFSALSLEFAWGITMLTMTSGSRPFRCATVILGLLLAFSATACNRGPTAPSFDDLVRTYTGRWRGNINGVEVVLDVQARKGSLSGGLDFLGTGTARSATGEIHPLRVRGESFTGMTPLLDFSVEREGTGPGVILIYQGSFDSELPRDGRTWSGRFRPPPVPSAANIFGPGEHPVTLTKD